MIRTMAAAALIAALLPGAAARAQDAGEYALEAIPAPHAAPLYAGEMLLVTLRGVYDDDILLEKMVAPRAEGWSWTQLGHDTWREERIDGLSRRVFERRFAFFADRAGALTLPAFTHALTLPEGRERVVRPIVSAPVAVAVAPPPESAAWWLPAQALTVEEVWEGDAGALVVGQPLHRTITLTAQGLGADRLPPMPAIATEEVFAFPQPEERATELTPQGPVARVVWRWSILPETPHPVVLPALTLDWFDTQARQPRTVTLPAKRIAVAGAVLGVEARDPLLERLAPLAAPLALGLGFLGGLALLARGLTLRGGIGGRLRALLAAAAARRRLSRAAARGDVFAARRAAHGLAQSASPALRAAAEPALTAFDRAAYGPASAQEGADPATLARRLTRALRG